MKTKLLKKVRERFEIIDQPHKQLRADGHRWGPMFQVRDKESVLYHKEFYYEIGEKTHPDNLTREEALEKAWTSLTKRIHSLYAKKNRKVKEQPIKKEIIIWPKENPPKKKVRWFEEIW